MNDSFYFNFVKYEGEKPPLTEIKVINNEEVIIKEYLEVVIYNWLFNFIFIK